MMSQVNPAYSNAERQIISLFDPGHESESWGQLKLFCHQPPAIIVIQHQDSDFAVEVMIRAQKSEYKFYSSWTRGGSLTTTAKMTKKYAERAIALLQAAGIDARGVNLFGANGIALRQGLFGEVCYSWRDLRAAIKSLRRK